MSTFFALVGFLRPPTIVHSLVTWDPVPNLSAQVSFATCGICGMSCVRVPTFGVVSCLGLSTVSLLLATRPSIIPDIPSRSVCGIAFALISASARIVAMASFIVCVICTCVSLTVFSSPWRTFLTPLVKTSRVCFAANYSSALSTAHLTISLTPSTDKDIIETSSIRRFFGLVGLENVEGVALTARSLSSLSACPCPKADLCSNTFPIVSVAPALAPCMSISPRKRLGPPFQGVAKPACMALSIKLVAP